MLTKDKIERFYLDVERLGLKFPVATIAKKTEYSKGNVSQYLSKSLQPSEHFIDAFYQAFADCFKNVPREPPSQRSEPEAKGDYLPEYIQSILEQKRILEEQNQFLRRNFEVSLNSCPLISSSVSFPPVNFRSRIRPLAKRCQ